MTRQKYCLCLILMMTMVFSGCGKEAAQEEGSESAAGETTITMLNIKTEVNDQILDLAKQYEAETGVHVEVLSSGPSVDAQAMLKGYYLSDQIPCAQLLRLLQPTKTS